MSFRAKKIRFLVDLSFTSRYLRGSTTILSSYQELDYRRSKWLTSCLPMFRLDLCSISNTRDSFRRAVIYIYNHTFFTNSRRLEIS